MDTTDRFPRNSRRAMHYINQAPSYGYACGVTENQVQNRSGGATSDREHVSCEACRARISRMASTRDKFPLASKLWDAHIADCCERPALVGQHLDEASSISLNRRVIAGIPGLKADKNLKILEW